MSALESTAWSVSRPNDRDDIRRVLSTIIAPRLKPNSRPRSTTSPTSTRDRLVAPKDGALMIPSSFRSSAAYGQLSASSWPRDSRRFGSDTLREKSQNILSELDRLQVDR